MNTTQLHLLAGAAGKIDIRVDTPEQPIGMAWLGHPHPLFGGTRDNKVVQTVNRALLALGYITVMPNFRGVGQSESVFDNGVGELADAVLTLQWMTQQFKRPLVLAGFSFGSVIAAQLASTQAQPPEHTVLIGTAVTRWSVPPITSNSLVIHGARDDVIPLTDVLAWAHTTGVKVCVIENAGHFFHGHLIELKNRLFEHWGRNDLLAPE